MHYVTNLDISVS